MKQMNIILGIGCDRGASLKTLETAVNQALLEAKLSRQCVSALATIDKKHDELALLSLSSEHDWPLNYFSAEQLAAVEVPNPSEVVRKYMGTPAVAEAAAILAANTDMTDLIVEKIKYLGEDKKNATVSIVRMHNE